MYFFSYPRSSAEHSDGTHPPGPSSSTPPPSSASSTPQYGDVDDLPKDLSGDKHGSYHFDFDEKPGAGGVEKPDRPGGSSSPAIVSSPEHAEPDSNFDDAHPHQQSFSVKPSPTGAGSSGGLKLTVTKSGSVESPSSNLAKPGSGEAQSPQHGAEDVPTSSVEPETAALTASNIVEEEEDDEIVVIR